MYTCWLTKHQSFCMLFVAMVTNVWVLWENLFVNNYSFYFTIIMQLVHFQIHQWSSFIHIQKQLYKLLQPLITTKFSADCSYLFLIRDSEFLFQREMLTMPVRSTDTAPSTCNSTTKPLAMWNRSLWSCSKKFTCKTMEQLWFKKDLSKLTNSFYTKQIARENYNLKHNCL